MVPDEFYKIYSEFAKDLLHTFPELDDIVKVPLTNEGTIESIFEHCKEVYPVRFFDILNKNNDIFNDKETNTEFLPGVDFSKLWHDDDLTENTRDAIWKHLQLIMFSIVGTIEAADSFGDTAKMFETMKEEDLKEKLQKTIEQLQNMLSNANNIGESMNDKKENSDKNNDDNDDNSNTFNIDDSNLPDADVLHNHISSLMGGKLGKLANEIAEETVNELNLDGLDDAENIGDVFNKMFKNPGKLMNMVNNISGKLDKKLKSGDINEVQIMQEASELMRKMENIPGVPNMQDLFKNMSNMSNAQKGAAKSKIDFNEKMNTQKERMRRKLEERRKYAEAQNNAANASAANASVANASVANASALSEWGPKVSKQTPSKSKKGNKNKKKR